MDGLCGSQGPSLDTGRELWSGSMLVQTQGVWEGEGGG